MSVMGWFRSVILTEGSTVPCPETVEPLPGLWMTTERGRELRRLLNGDGGLGCGVRQPPEPGLDNVGIVVG
jgi:hypothetical protein